jgi:hypothetical protein
MNPAHAADAESADAGPFLSVIVSAKNGGVEVGASVLRERASRWDDAHIQAQLRLQPGRLTADAASASSASSASSVSGASGAPGTSAAARSAAACLREEWDLDVYQFTDSATLGNLESLLVRTAPARVYYCSSAPKAVLKQLEQLFATLGFDATAAAAAAAVACPPSMYGAGSLEADLARLTGNAAPSQEIRDMNAKRKLSGQSLAGLVRKRSLMEDQRKHGRYHVTTKYLTQFVRLDAAAANALNLFPEPRAVRGSSNIVVVFIFFTRRVPACSRA